MSTTTNEGRSQSESTVIVLQLIIIATSVMLTVFMSFFEKNKKGGSPGIVIPIDFLKYDRLTFVYAAAFGCTSSEVVNLIFNRDDWFQSTKIHKFIIPWIRVLVWLFMALLVAIKFYPVFAVIRCKRIIVEPLIGFLYTGLIFGTFVYTINLQLKELRLSSFVLVYIPSNICYVIIIVYFLCKLYQHLRRKANESSSEKSLDLQKRCATQHQYLYLKWLLSKRRNKSMEHNSKKSRFANLKWRLRKRLGFDSQLRGSPRVISTFVVACIVLYQLGIWEIILYSKLSKVVFDELEERLYNSTYHSTAVTLHTVCDVGFYISITISSIFITLYMIVIYSNYRKDLERMHRGDYSFLPMKMRKTMNDDLLAASLRYAGLQVAFLLWCYSLSILVLFVMCLATAYMVVLPIKGDVSFSFFEPVLVYLPLLIVALVLLKSQSLLSRKFFLQEYSAEVNHTDLSKRSLALDNTRCFNVLTFLAFFFHAIIGLVSALNRVFIGLIIGLVAMARIDRCMLPAGFENFDRGYGTYVGMILVELHHRNPVVAVFCDTLLSKKKSVNALSHLIESHKKETANERYDRVKRRWLKAYTMLNNSSVRSEVKPMSFECSKDEIHMTV